MNFDEVKTKLRKLKRLEIKLRLNDKTSPPSSLVWDSFFDLHEAGKSKSKYSLAMLTSMSKEEYECVINEYLSFLYTEMFKETCSQPLTTYDSDALIQLGLPYDAGEKEIKRRFRELAMLYHPDTGGDAGKFIEMMSVYKRLIK